VKLVGRLIDMIYDQIIRSVFSSIYIADYTQNTSILFLSFAYGQVFVQLHHGCTDSHFYLGNDDVKIETYILDYLIRIHSYVSTHSLKTSFGANIH